MDINRSSEIRKSLLKSNESALLHAEAVRADRFQDQAFYEKHVREYVLCKFRLDTVGSAETSLKKLAEESIRYLVSKEGMQLHYKDTVTKCDGMSSSGTKISLLFMAVQKEFGLKLPVAKIAKIDTVSDLATVVREVLTDEK